jgi:hypothetical protein
VARTVGEVTRRVVDWPVLSSFDVRPLMLKAWGCEAGFVILKITPRGALFALRT